MCKTWTYVYECTHRRPVQLSTCNGTFSRSVDGPQSAAASSSPWTSTPELSIEADHITSSEGTTPRIPPSLQSNPSKQRPTRPACQRTSSLMIYLARKCGPCTIDQQLLDLNIELPLPTTVPEHSWPTSCTNDVSQETHHSTPAIHFEEIEAERWRRDMEIRRTIPNSLKRRTVLKGATENPASAAFLIAELKAESDSSVTRRGIGKERDTARTTGARGSLLRREVIFLDGEDIEGEVHDYTEEVGEGSLVADHDVWAAYHAEWASGWSCGPESDNACEDGAWEEERDDGEAEALTSEGPEALLDEPVVEADSEESCRTSSEVAQDDHADDAQRAFDLSTSHIIRAVWRQSLNGIRGDSFLDRDTKDDDSERGQSAPLLSNDASTEGYSSNYSVAHSSPSDPSEAPRSRVDVESDLIENAASEDSCLSRYSNQPHLDWWSTGTLIPLA